MKLYETLCKLRFSDVVFNNLRQTETREANTAKETERVNSRESGNREKHTKTEKKKEKSRQQRKTETTTKVKTTQRR